MFKSEFLNEINTRGFIYLSNRGTCISRKTIWNIIKIACINSGLKRNKIGRINLYMKDF